MLTTSYVSPRPRLVSRALPGDAALAQDHQLCKELVKKAQCYYVLKLPQQNSLLQMNCFGHMLMAQGSTA